MVRTNPVTVNVAAGGGGGAGGGGAGGGGAGGGEAGETGAVERKKRGVPWWVLALLVVTAVVAGTSYILRRSREK